jgi:hypothetical protein
LLHELHHGKFDAETKLIPMKNFYTTCLLFFGLLLSALNNQLAAQTDVSVNYHYEYGQAGCTVPETWNFYVMAQTTNYAATDNANIYIDFGDGNFTNVTVSQVFFNSTQANVYPSNYIPHTYNAAGNYTVTYIVTMPDANADTVTANVMVTNVCNNVTGRLYMDVNSDCIYNAGDYPLQSIQVRLDYNGNIASTGNTDAQGLFTMSACPGYTYNLLTDTSNYYSSPSFVFTCATFQGIAVTPSPNASQDLIAADVHTIHITSAGDSASFNSGNCVPYTANFYMFGSAVGYAAPADSFDLYINFGDGQDTTITTVSNGSGPAAIGNLGYPYIVHTYTATGSYNVLYAATGPDGVSDTVIRYNEITVSDTCGNVEGYCYIDNNNNCVFDAGDSAFAWMYLELTPASGYPYWAYTDANGHYSFSVPPGNYTLSISSYAMSYLGLTPTCPSSGSTSVTVTAANTVTADFATVCPTSFDLTGMLFVTHGIFPTSVGYVHPYTQNLSCTPPPSGSVTLTLDPLVHYVGVCDTSFHPVVSGNTITWNFSSQSVYYAWYYWYTNFGCIEVIGDPALQMGDTVCFTMSITPTAGDMNPANNTVTRCVPALVSLDPNAKEVLPRGSGPQGYVPENTTFDYKVEFQNTGTAVARDIFILDSLDSDLDLSTLVVTGSSHQMQPQLLPGNVLKFNFDDIYLADSTSDEQHSHGWVTYRITAKPALPNGTQIQNTAGIYFDFNAPVMTNSTLNTVVDPSSVNEITSNDASVFPNPASSSVEISLGKESTGVYSLTDLTGKIIFTGKIQGRSAMIDVSTLPQGVYLLNIETEQGRSVHKVAVQH